MSAALDHAPSFAAMNNDALRGLGLAGPHYRATFGRGVLALEGSEGGRIEIAPALVERVRFGSDTTDPKAPATSTLRFVTIWRRGAGPIRLVVRHDETPGYYRTMKSFAAAVAAGGLARVEVGNSRAYALFWVVAGILCVGWLMRTAYPMAMRTGSLWDWMLVGLLGLVLVGGVWGAVNRRPRPVRRLDDIDRELA